MTNHRENVKLHQLNFVSACEKGNLDMAKKILKNNPNINISFHNDDAFQSACQNRHLIVAEWLLEIKPDIDIATNGEYVFNYACKNGHL